MKKVTETEIKVGIFIVMGLVLATTSIIFLGGSKSFFSKQVLYHMHFESVDGLIIGAKVMLGGIQVGTVSEVEFDEKTRNIRVDLAIQDKRREWIRGGSLAEIATQGVLGDKYLMIQMGSPDQEPLPAGSEIPVKPSKDIAQFLNKSDALLVSLNSVASSLDRTLQTFERAGRSEAFFTGIANTAKNLSVVSGTLAKEIEGLKLKDTTRELNQILQKINNGNGTVGALINDPLLYDDLKSLMGGANRSRIVRNMVRKAVNDEEEAKAKKRMPGNEN